MPVEVAARRLVDQVLADDPGNVAALELNAGLERMGNAPAPEQFNLLSTLRDASSWLKHRLLHGAACPACGQFAKIYQRTITSPMARTLIVAWDQHGIEWFHMPSLVGASRGDEAKLVHWGLLEEEKVLRPDGGRAGFWRVTDDGAQFAQGHITVPKYALIYDGRCYGHDGDLVDIRACLGERFRLDELMGRTVVTPLR